MQIIYLIIYIGFLSYVFNPDENEEHINCVDNVEPD
jgi:hypothetical protein